MKTLTQIVHECVQKIVAEDVSVILYAASAFCGRIVRAFVNSGIRPACICDGDVYKQGKIYYGLNVIRPEEAVELYPDAKFFITSAFHAPEIIGRLVNDFGVKPEQILNYEDVEWKRSCPYLETEAYLLADSSKVNFCCSDFGKLRTPSVEIDNDYVGSAIKIVQYKDRLISDLQNGISDSACAHCAWFKKGYYYTNRKVRKLTHNNGGGCNYRCIYCSNSAKHPVKLNNPDPVRFADLLLAFRQLGELSDDAKLIMGAGEFTIHPDRSSLYELCGYAEYILTNGSIYDENVDKILSKGNTALEISIDAGTRETYGYVKGIDFFDKAIKNIKRYTDNKNSSVHLKYIFLPDINDNINDVNGFVDLCSGNNIDFAVISYDINLDINNVPDNTLKMIRIMVEGFDKMGILFADYSGLTKTRRYKIF